MKKAAFVFLVTLCTLTGCSPLSEKETASTTITPENSDPVSTLATENNSVTQRFELIFKDINQPTKPLMKAIPTEKQTLLTSKKINNSEIEIYQINPDTENTYAALLSGSTKYDIGQIGYSSTQKTNDFTIDKVDVLSKSFIKITGFCGANCPITDYVLADTSPPVLLRIDAHTIEADVDNEGSKEIIATVGTAAQTSLYMLQGERIVTVNLNEVMNASVVMYNSGTNTFQAEVTKSELSNWSIINNQIQLVP